MQEVFSSQAILREKGLVQASIVIPVYNQERRISGSLRRIKDAVDSIFLTNELIVVDDGSYDNTLEILRKEEKLDPRVRVISYQGNRGKGYAVKTGVMHSAGAVVMFLDGDLDICPSVIKDYMRELHDCDLIVGSKRHHLSKVKICLSRRVLSRIFSVYVRAVVGIRIKDTQAGLKGGDGDKLRSIFAILQVTRYAFDVELLAIASLLNLRIKEVPIDVTINRRFKLHDITRMFVDVLRIAFRYRMTKRDQKRLELHTREEMSKTERIQ